MKVKRRRKNYYIIGTDPYFVEEYGICNEYGPYQTQEEAVEILKGAERMMTKGAHYNIPKFEGGILEEGVYKVTFNGLEFRIKDNEVWCAGERVAVYPKPPTNENLLQLSSELLTRRPDRTAATKTAKKTSTKSPSKRTTKKTSKRPAAKKAPAKKAATKAAAPKKKEGGLKPNQVKILQALAKGGEMDRKTLASVTGIAKGYSRLLGASTKDGGAKPDSLAGMGYVKDEVMPGGKDDKGRSRIFYTITAAGKKAIENEK